MIDWSNVDDVISANQVEGYKTRIDVGSQSGTQSDPIVISITYYKFWVKDGLEYSNYHVQSTRNHGFMDDKFDYFSDKPELAVRLYLGETITVSDTVKYEKPLWASPTVNDSRTLPDDDGDGVGTTATYKYLGQLDVNGTYNMNYDYFYLRTHQIAYSTRTSVTIPREVTFDGTTYKVTAIQKWGMDYTKTHIWLSDYCYNMKSDGGGNQDKTNKVTEHQNINDHRNEYLTSITFESPSNVHSIGDYAFMSMYNSETKTGLEYIEIPSSVEYLGTGVFECCLALNDVEFQTYTNDAGVASTHVPEIRDYAFWCCVALEEITLPDGITKIGDCSFQYNFKLSKIELPNTLTTIGDHFLCCASSLRTLTIPYAVTDIAGACFHGCESLENVYLMGPASALQKESGSGGTFDANPRFCKDHVHDCHFWVFKEYYQGYKTDDVWKEIDENGAGLNGNWLSEVPDITRTFEADKWVSAIFYHPQTNYKSDATDKFGSEARVAVLTGATVTEGQERDPKTLKPLRMYNLIFTLITSNDIPANTPVMICPSKETTITLFTAEESANNDDFKYHMTQKHPITIDCGDKGSVSMKGQYTPYSLQEWDFFFAYDPEEPEEPAKFYRVKKNTNYSVDRGRCWWTVQANGVSGGGTMAPAKDANGLNIFMDNETDGIQDFENRVVIGGIYDLNGRKLDVAPEDLPQGIFIVNGKKHVVK